VRTTSTRSRFARAAALGLTAALVAGASLLGATSAQAVDGVYYSVTGVVNDSSAAPLAGVKASITIPDPGYSDTVLSDTTASDGTFTLVGVPDGTYTINFSLDGYDAKTASVTVLDGDKALGSPVVMTPTPPALTAGTVSISGTPVVGNVLTADTAGWPAGTTLSYEWFYNCGECGGSIDGQTASTYTVTNTYIGNKVGVIVTGTKAGFSNTSVSALLDTVVSAPKKPTGPAPAGTTGSTPAAQTSAGLPAGPLDPAQTYSANVNWASPDSYVDVYIFSTPTLVGTFPVVNGVAQITLSKAVLAKLSTGTHTLVITGQSSGAVQSVTVALGLAATGAANPAVPVTVASLLLLLGAGLLISRRRLAQNA
jgi:hypothetical protein